MNVLWMWVLYKIYQLQTVPYEDDGEQYQQDPGDADGIDVIPALQKCLGPLDEQDGEDLGGYEEEIEPEHEESGH